MSHTPPGPITSLLNAYDQGEPAALRELMDVVYPELKRRARLVLHKEYDARSWQATALVHEAFLRLFDGEPTKWENSGHFFSMAAKEMRRAVIDHARHLACKKRQPVEGFEDFLQIQGDRGITPDQLIDLNRAMTKLQEHSPRTVQVVEMRFFAGLSAVEIAAVLDVTPRTVARELAWGRAWLYDCMSGAVEGKLSPDELAS